MINKATHLVLTNQSDEHTTSCVGAKNIAENL